MQIIKHCIVSSFLLLIVLCVKAQENNKPQLLKEPASWEFERFPLPPSFSPNFPYKGVEELRFAPGMFKKDAADYFSYAFVAQLEGVKTLSSTEIKNYLLNYFKGLCASVAKEKKMQVDTTAVTVDVSATPNTEQVYDATLNVFGVFADGAIVKLYAEVKVLADTKNNIAYLLFITSSKEKTAAIWKELHKIQNDFKLPG